MVLVSPGASVLGLWIPSFPVHLHVSVCMCVCVHNSSSYKDISHIGLGPTLMISFELSHLFIASVSNHSHILRHWGVGLDHINCVRDTI